MLEQKEQFEGDTADHKAAAKAGLSLADFRERRAAETVAAEAAWEKKYGLRREDILFPERKRAREQEEAKARAAARKAKRKARAAAKKKKESSSSSSKSASSPGTSRTAAAASGVPPPRRVSGVATAAATATAAGAGAARGGAGGVGGGGGGGVGAKVGAGAAAAAAVGGPLSEEETAKERELLASTPLKKIKTEQVQQMLVRRGLSSLGEREELLLRMQEALDKENTARLAEQQAVSH